MKRIRITAAVLLALSVLAAIFGLAFASSNRIAEGSLPQKSFDEYMDEGNYYFDSEQYQMALINYKGAIELEPTGIEAQRRIAEVYEILEYNSEAEDAYEKLVHMDEKDIESWLSYSRIMIQNGKKEEAKKNIEDLLKTTDDLKVVSLYENMNVDPPEFNLESGTYDSYQLLKLENPDEKSNVYYTTDGSDPTKDSLVIKDGIVLSRQNNHIIAKSIGYLGYESAPVELNIVIDVPEEIVQKTGNGNTFIGEIGYSMDKDYGDPIYNYELAQIRSLYVVGHYAKIEDPGITFHEDGYEIYESTNTNKSKFDEKDLQYFPFLKKLCIGWQKEIDMNRLPRLSYLEELSVLNSDVTDISAVSDMKNLKKLALGWNEIEDVSPISSLDQLVSLGMWNNRISEIGSLSGLTGLLYFDITNNSVTDISALSNMTGLKEVWIKNNQIHDLSPLGSCETLQILYQSGNPITEYGTVIEKTVRTDIKGE